jgi:hypothetical protein
MWAAFHLSRRWQQLSPYSADLCWAQGIKGYPELNLCVGRLRCRVGSLFDLSFYDGKHIAQYQGVRTLESLTTWLELNILENEAAIDSAPPAPAPEPLASTGADQTAPAVDAGDTLANPQAPLSDTDVLARIPNPEPVLV